MRFFSIFKSLVACILLLSLVSSCALFTRTPARKAQHRYIPEEFHNIFLGMAMDNFIQIRENLVLQESFIDFRSVITENINRNGIIGVTYYFDNDNQKPLYEMIIEYDSVNTRDNATKKMLGKPDLETGEWQFQSGEGFDIIAWELDNKLVIAAKLPGTEWE
ncbi:MAG: hypothetical protein JXB60_07545 [Candidatus Cloacimonetes bacterium]|nr:hypothetical protein [Candidatus Cloacimonadota bacterium]